MLSSWSGGKDLAAWILAVVGVLLITFLLRWSERRVEGSPDALFNKDVAVNHLVLSSRGGHQLFLAGLGGEREKPSTPMSKVVEELLPGHGAEEECSCSAAKTTSAWCFYLGCFRCGGSTLKFLLSVGRGVEGEKSGGVADVLPWKRRLWSSESATTSVTPKHRLRAATISGSWDGPAELEQSRSSSVPLLLCWRIFSDLGATGSTMASPSGFVPGGAPGGRGWRSNLIGVMLGLNRVSSCLCRVLFVKLRGFVVFSAFLGVFYVNVLMPPN
jgi:hypothetical protein